MAVPLGTSFFVDVMHLVNLGSVSWNFFKNSGCVLRDLIQSVHPRAEVGAPKCSAFCARDGSLELLESLEPPGGSRHHRHVGLHATHHIVERCVRRRGLKHQSFRQPRLTRAHSLTHSSSVLDPSFAHNGPQFASTHHEEGGDGLRQWQLSAHVG